MGYVAHTRHLRTGRESTRDVPSAENGAEQLFMLMTMAGWSEDRDSTLARLVSGESLTHKGFTYWIEGDDR